MANVTNLTEEQKKELAFTPEERAQLDIARTMPIVYDEDCPAVTPERAAKFKRVNPLRDMRQVSVVG